MLNIHMLSFLFFLHWVSDYVFQERAVADNKWNSVMHLAEHVTLYVAPFVLFTFVYATTFTAGWSFLVYLWISHFVIDFFTSKASHMYYEQKDYKMFFTVLGADQVFHTLTFFVLLNWFIL